MSYVLKYYMAAGRSRSMVDIKIQFRNITHFYLCDGRNCVARRYVALEYALSQSRRAAN